MKSAQDILNILIISLDDKFAKNVAKLLADTLDMFVADTREMIEYDLSDSKTVLKTCGLEYLKKREKKVVAKCSCYENTVLTINIDLFKEYYDIFENSLIIYFERKQKSIAKTVNKIGFENYNEFMKNNSDLFINSEKLSVNDAANLAMERMRDIL